MVAACLILDSLATCHQTTRFRLMSVDNISRAMTSAVDKKGMFIVMIFINPERGKG